MGGAGAGWASRVSSLDEVGSGDGAAVLPRGGDWARRLCHGANPSGMPVTLGDTAPLLPPARSQGTAGAASTRGCQSRASPAPRKTWEWSLSSVGRDGRSHRRGEARRGYPPPSRSPKLGLNWGIPKPDGGSGAGGDRAVLGACRRGQPRSPLAWREHDTPGEASERLEGSGGACKGSTGPRGVTSPNPAPKEGEAPP